MTPQGHIMVIDAIEYMCRRRNCFRAEHMGLPFCALIMGGFISAHSANERLRRPLRVLCGNDRRRSFATHRNVTTVFWQVCH